MRDFFNFSLGLIFNDCRRNRNRIRRPFLSAFAVNVLVKIYYVSCLLKVLSSWRTVFLFHNCTAGILFVSFSVIIVAPDVWLSFLTKQIPEDQKDKTIMTIYGCLIGACFILTIVRAYGFLLICLSCAVRLHEKMVVAILQAPVLFFDSNPAGRILNRFSNDIGCVDELLPKTFLGAIQMLLMIFASVLLPIATDLWLLFLAVPLIALVLYISKYYLKTARELKRLESICRSPVFSHFSETLIGLDTIRTRRRQRHFVDAFYRYVSDTSVGIPSSQTPKCSRSTV